MKVCIPIEKNDGKDTMPYGHFGSAPMLAICDTETDGIEFIDKGAHDSHGACTPMASLEGYNIAALIVGGIGARAIMGLNASGIKIYRAVQGNLAENVALFKNGRLVELTPEGGCSQHGGGGC